MPTVGRAKQKWRLNGGSRCGQAHKSPVIRSLGLIKLILLMHEIDTVVWKQNMAVRKLHHPDT